MALIRSQRHGGDLGEHDDAGLGSAVRAHACRRLRAVERGDGDDAAAVVHGERSVLDGEEDTRDAEVEDGAPLVEGVVDDG